MVEEGLQEELGLGGLSSDDDVDGLEPLVAQLEVDSCREGAIFVIPGRENRFIIWVHNVYVLVPEVGLGCVGLPGPMGIGGRLW